MTSGIRAFVAGDYHRVHELWLACEGIGLGPGDSEAGVTAFLLRNDGLSFVVESEGAIVAAVLCGHDGRRGFIYHLAVERSHRRRGIASALLTRCLDGLKASGIGRGQVSVFATNEVGKAFWANQGGSLRSDLAVFTLSLQKSDAPGSC